MSKKTLDCKEKQSIYFLNYVLSFETMAIMASYFFFINMNFKEFKPKIHLMKFEV
jgi:hypothetical protein